MDCVCENGVIFKGFIMYYKFIDFNFKKNNLLKKKYKFTKLLKEIR